ncbi:thiolase family protein [Paraburkholderia silviterrae]|uniref:Thiolase family protein n=1 Tax=Paraburkholderia silviterrae TaxID=2528715 RepID=A0A4R5M2M5_9BURK|nr:thiolase family protein [Paraburkholderia silviterrae]TDG19342.1 thiolase family protein [Paraburkholderia silviterrae]
MSARQVVICNPVRTPIGAFGGALKDVPATTLGAAAVRETVRRSKIDPAELASVVMGNVIQAGNRMNPARQAAVGGGVPVAVPALSVNRVCGSGAQAIVNAAQEIWLGFGDVAVAGGMENMDRAPYLLGSGRWGQRMGNVEIIDSMLTDGLVDAFSGQHSGWHTEDLVAKLEITRERQDRWAERSQKRFAAAQARGAFDAELVAVEIEGRKQAVKFERDEQPRPDTTFEALAKLRPAFRPDGTITAGNAPGLNSGASAMVVAERQYAEAHGIEPIARIVSYGVAAVEPGMFGLGPVPAVHMALARAGWSLSDVQRFEINEAFAAVPLAVLQQLGIDEELVNVEGGAIAHGHAIGATGAVLTTRLVHSMRRDGIKRGIVTLCIGGGQGIAVALEAL